MIPVSRAQGSWQIQTQAQEEEVVEVSPGGSDGVYDHNFFFYASYLEPSPWDLRFSIHQNMAGIEPEHPSEEIPTEGANVCFEYQHKSPVFPNSGRVRIFDGTACESELRGTESLSHTLTMPTPYTSKPTKDCFVSQESFANRVLVLESYDPVLGWQERSCHVTGRDTFDNLKASVGGSGSYGSGTIELKIFR